jgi:hypothetical protein
MTGLVGFVGVILAAWFVATLADLAEVDGRDW